MGKLLPIDCKKSRVLWLWYGWAALCIVFHRWSYTLSCVGPWGDCCKSILWDCLLLAARSGTEGKAMDEFELVTYSYSFFHLIFALASMYIAMLMTGWGTGAEERDLIDVGWTSVWVKVVAQWMTVGVYAWTMAAPLLFPDRDFSWFDCLTSAVSLQLVHCSVQSVADVLCKYCCCSCSFVLHSVLVACVQIFQSIIVQYSIIVHVCLARQNCFILV